MKNYTQDELKKIYSARREKLLAYMTEHGITVAVFAFFSLCLNFTVRSSGYHRLHGKFGCPA